MLIQLTGAVLHAAEMAEEHHVELPVSPYVYGGVIMALLLLLMLVTVSFTNVGNRHEAEAEHVDPQRQFANKHDHGQAIQD
ncbi:MULTISPECIES: hypothetical protein [unclassified Arthrobacter]|uniref:hypothetical protein n=1 Tax=unclassified Arthrobacter TaxID=235627 RepID=UPI001D1354F4|nr:MULTISPECIES: hypothetical protein [unclassified Arthrobacter]MCC3274993.1 hypothetical protein [Arthrobacter sp. zg-Y20]MCC3279035.1 hypothetical protein [Arthrobacter sp. zg-Y40]MCC9177410.1 hypothetical protein [Arthrobacter sp. zg-Y750]MDK1315150.1 hypothetical protein [Arthrobacter sp. zg.Y20]MDK1328011.1 hypothetical protein [Arthrobacter sp. zg-Y1143]